MPLHEAQRRPLFDILRASRAAKPVVSGQWLVVSDEPERQQGKGSRLKAKGRSDPTPFLP